MLGPTKKMKLKLIEPLKNYFKDEVRTLGKSMNISKDILNRHPFPGPGLAIRILGAVTNEKIKILQEADSVFIEELLKKIYIIKFGKHMLLFYPLKPLV